MKKDTSLLDNVFVVLFGVLLAFAITEKNLSDIIRGAIIVLVTLVVAFLTVGVNNKLRKNRIIYYVVCTIISFFGSFLIFVWDIPDGVSVFFIWSLPISVMVWSIGRELTLIYIQENEEESRSMSKKKNKAKKSAKKK